MAFGEPVMSASSISLPGLREYCPPIYLVEEFSVFVFKIYSFMSERESRSKERGGGTRRLPAKHGAQ